MKFIKTLTISLLVAVILVAVIGTLRTPQVVAAIPYSNNPVNIGNYFYEGSTTPGTQIATGTGVLYTIAIENPVAGSVIQIYDATSTSAINSNLISSSTVVSSPQPTTLTFNVAYTRGLYIVQSTATSSLTISYR